MKTIILAGGLGTRLAEETEAKPKPMVAIGGWPTIWHIMNVYATHGHKDFIAALGYKGEVIKHYFLNYHKLRHSVSVHLATGDATVHDRAQEDWNVHLIETGLHTESGGRIKRLSAWVASGTFMMTYGDGVADINITDLLAFHRKHGRLATVTGVRPPARFGGLSIEGDLVTDFVEKPQIGEGWINGGFFVLEPGVLEYIHGDETNFERESLTSLAQDRQLAVYRHEGFWQCMDTLRDVRLLNSLWDGNKAPWKVWQ